MPGTTAEQRLQPGRRVAERKRMHDKLKLPPNWTANRHRDLEQKPCEVKGTLGFLDGDICKTQNFLSRENMDP